MAERQSQSQVPLKNMCSKCKQNETTCPNHPDEKLRFWCQNCKIPVCRDCILLRHQSHTSTEMTEIAQEQANEQKDMFVKTQLCLYQAMKQTVEMIMPHEDATIESVTEVFNSIRSMISDCEYQLKEKILFIRQTNRELVESIQQQLEQKHDELNRKTSNLDQFFLSKNPTKLLQHHHETMEYLESNMKEINKMTHVIKPKYRIQGLNELQVTVADALQRVLINEWHSDIVNSNLKSIHKNVRWMQNSINVAGGHGRGNKLNQLSNPTGFCIDDKQTIYIVDHGNHRIIAWKAGTTRGRVVAGKYGPGNEDHQLNKPCDVTLDKRTDHIIISDWGNRRVVRWPRLNGTKGETIISNINCMGLTIDERGFLYVVNQEKHEVRRYEIGRNEGTIVAGGYGKGYYLNQLSAPCYVSVDLNHSVYVSDSGNHRVMKWEEGAQEGVIVAGRKSKGISPAHLSDPQGIMVDPLGTVYIADAGNRRIMCWLKGAARGHIIVDGNSQGSKSNHLLYPISLSFDRHGNLYVADFENHRIQKFSINST